MSHVFDLTSDFKEGSCDIIFTQKSAAIWWVHMQRPPGPTAAHGAGAGAGRVLHVHSPDGSSIHQLPTFVSLQFLIHSTFILVSVRIVFICGYGHIFIRAAEING